MRSRFRSGMGLSSGFIRCFQHSDTLHVSGASAVVRARGAVALATFIDATAPPSSRCGAGPRHQGDKILHEGEAPPHLVTPIESRGSGHSLAATSDDIPRSHQLRGRACPLFWSRAARPNDDQAHGGTVRRATDILKRQCRGSASRYAEIIEGSARVRPAPQRNKKAPPNTPPPARQKGWRMRGSDLPQRCPHPVPAIRRSDAIIVSFAEGSPR